jgi:hypothetical protein
MRRPLVIYDFATRSLQDFLLYEEIFLSFLSGTKVLFLRPTRNFVYLLCIWINFKHIWPIVSVPFDN